MKTVIYLCSIKLQHMKTIIIEGVEYQYRIRRKHHPECIESFTDFYTKTYSLTYRKYKFFGEIITIEEPLVKFTIGCDIESPYCSKEYIRGLIERELKPIKRSEEIKRGEII